MIKVKNDLTGKTFGMLTVLRQVEDYVAPCGQHKAMWECQCSCENHTVINVVASSLLNNQTKSCGCQCKSKYIDLTGRQFGRLTVICRVSKPENRKNGGAYWLCECSCEDHNQIICSSSDLNSKHVQSCGCLCKEINAKGLSEANKKSAGVGKKNKVTKFYKENGYAYGYTSNTNKKFYIDLEDVPYAKKYTWYENDQGYIMSRIDGKLIRLHRAIMNCNDDMMIDHINHKKYDNRKSNLRKVTASQNCMNKKAKGVYFDKKTGKYIAHIGIDYKKKCLGYFSHINDAINARKLAEEKYFGEYSYDKSMSKDVAVNDS